MTARGYRVNDFIVDYTCCICGKMTAHKDTVFEANNSFLSYCSTKCKQVANLKRGKGKTRKQEYKDKFDFILEKTCKRIEAKIILGW